MSFGFFRRLSTACVFLWKNIFRKKRIFFFIFFYKKYVEKEFLVWKISGIVVVVVAAVAEMVVADLVGQKVVVEIGQTEVDQQIGVEIGVDRKAAGAFDRNHTRSFLFEKFIGKNPTL